jgi:putative ABC transport system permease protein
VGQNETYVITGIAEDTPSNSHFKYNVILSMESWDYSHNPSWLGNNLQNYIKLNEQADYHLVDEKFPRLVEKYIGPQVQQVLGMSLQQFYDQGGLYGFYLQPMLRIHLYPQTQSDLEPPGNIQVIYLLSAIVLLIILIACINFMNLSTARYTDRVKEVGVRKSLGASRKRLMGQFMAESLILTALSMFMAILLLWMFLGEFNMISDKTITIQDLFTPQFIGGMGIIILVVGFLAGSYPAIYLTSFNPIDILRSKIGKGVKSRNFRSYFVLFQFTMSIALIISTLLIFKQLKYVQTKDLGFDKENVMVLKNIEGLGKDKLAFREELKKLNDVSSASITNHTPPDFNQSTVFKALGGAQEDFPSTYCVVDMDQAVTLELEMAAGRFFSEDFPSDSSAVVVNETTARLLGWENPIGQKIETYWREGQSDIREVIGVVRDFHFQSLHREMSSLFIFYGTSGNKMLVRLTAGNIQKKIKLIESKWKAFAPGQPFEFSFIDADFDAKFRQDQQMGMIFLIFTALALFVACLGLLGLATFMAEQRSKEIGIRKIMGASNPGIIQLLSLEYLKLIGISFVLSIPLTYMLITWWLNNFAYKTNIGILSFLIGGGITLVIALLSVAYHSIRAALRNPVESLRYE